MSTFIQVTPFDNISDVAHSDEVLEGFATITINTSNIVALSRPSRSNNNSIKMGRFTYTPTKITLVTGTVIKVCESYDYLRAAVHPNGLDLYHWSGPSYVQGVRTDRFGNAIVEEQG